MASDMRNLSTLKGRPSDVPSGSHAKFLNGRSFLLEIEHRPTLRKVAESIENAGGNIMAAFEEVNPHCVVSDHHMVPRIEKAKIDDPVFSEKNAKLLPALLREAIKRHVKIRTPTSFLNQMTSFFNRREKTTSATTSNNSTIRGKPSLGRTSGVKLERNMPRLPECPLRYLAEKPPRKEVKEVKEIKVVKEQKPFLRIDLPGRKPDIRFVPKDSFGTLYCGSDAGYSIFKQTDSSLSERRRRDYELFCKGTFEPNPKPFKMDERDNYCQFCHVTIIGDKKEHERTDQHRAKVRARGLSITLERIILNTRLNLQSQENRLNRKRKLSQENALMAEKSKRAGVEYEYGENEMNVNWLILKPSVVKTSEKRNVLSPRRRQNRILLSQGDNEFL